MLSVLYGVFATVAICMLRVLVFAGIGWILSLTFMGAWISDAIAAIVRPVELYKIGALVGFVTSLRLNVSLPSSDELKTAWRGLIDNRL